MDADSLRAQREAIRRKTQSWLLDIMLAHGAGAVLTRRQHLRVLQARKDIETLSDQLTWAAVS
ncbi:hypothetical protein [Mycobacterium sp. M23085]|uniref:hypothetical protein n=1 Tax=Mycobacterium sp. M23085 TaxID=3378087 RepID=UPI003877973E